MPRARATTKTLDQAPTVDPAADTLPPDFPTGPEGGELAPAPPAEPERRRPGRPAGSKNRPKTDVAPVTGDSGTKGKGGRKPRFDVAANISQTMQTVGTVITIAGTARESAQLAFDGRVILVRADEIGEAVAAIAAENPQVRAAIERMYKTGGWAKIGLVAAAVAVPIAANHGMAPTMFATPFLTAGTGPIPPRPERKRPEPPRPQVPEWSSDESDLTGIPDLDAELSTEDGVPTWSPQ